jgi:mono/diheme cytochrome c family protein
VSLGARLCVGALALVGAAAVVGAIGFAWSGVSARPEPSKLEALVARAARDFLIPAAARRATNPLDAGPQLLDRAQDHFAEHCAFCHGPDGRGDTEIGRGLNPRASDLTLAGTQALSDGDLFWIIENGVRLTGMPAFGNESAEDDGHAWSLVHWIRRLPELTPEQIEAMAREDEAPATGHEPHEHGQGH